MLALLGPSGSGKTTLLRIAAGIEPQTSGRVLLNDREIAGPSVFLPPERRSIGLVFQDFALFPHMTILDNVRFGLTALSREEALRFYTINNARLHHEGREKGSIEPGKLADLILVDRDPLTCPESELSVTQVLWTMVGGRIVYRADEPAR